MFVVRSILFTIMSVWVKAGNRARIPAVSALSANCMPSCSSRLSPAFLSGKVLQTGSVQRFSSQTGRAPLPPSPRVLPRQQQQIHVVETSAGTGRQRNNLPDLYARTRDRTPVSWPSFFLAGVAAASAVAYYRIERERRLERAMGKVVSSESDGWTPRPGFLAKRKFVATKWGWFPQEDGFGARECVFKNWLVRV